MLAKWYFLTWVLTVLPANQKPGFKSLKWFPSFRYFPCDPEGLTEIHFTKQEISLTESLKFGALITKTFDKLSMIFQNRTRTGLIHVLIARSSCGPLRISIGKFISIVSGITFYEVHVHLMHFFQSINHYVLYSQGKGTHDMHIHYSWYHYTDVIMRATASQITGVSIACSAVCSGVIQRKHQSPASLAFFRESTGDRWIPLTPKMFLFDDVIIYILCTIYCKTKKHIKKSIVKMQLCRHWCHRRSSSWRPPVPPVTAKLTS